MRAFFEETEFRSWIIFKLIQQFYVFSDFINVFDANFSWFRMIIVSLIVKNVSLKLIFAVFNDSLFVLKIFVGLFHFFINLACIVASGFGSVKLPFGQTQPAKIMIAFSTSHVHAPLVFFNVGVALWTGFTIGLDPSQIFRIILFFFNPELNKTALSGQMILLATFEAKSVAAPAFHNVVVAVFAFFDDVVASFLRTPLDILVVICKLFTVPGQVLLIVIHLIIRVWSVNQIFRKIWVWNHNITPELWARSKHTLCTKILYFDFKVIFPTDAAKLVAATELVSSHVFIIFIEFHVHNITHILVIFFESLTNFRIFFG